MMRILLGVLTSVIASLMPVAVLGDEPMRIDWEVVSRRPHDPAAFIQGLIMGPEGRLFESTGRYGESTLREVDPLTGAVVRSADLGAEFFGEGLALVEDRIIQLTWREGIALVKDSSDFEDIDSHEYEGEGWGLCFDGERFVMSDGSAELTFRDVETFAIIDLVDVTIAGEPQPSLNELECVDGRIWANVYRTDRIVRIDPASGEVDGILDLTGIIDPHPAEEVSSDVLNGIAWDEASGTFLVTGKRWPELIEIRLLTPNPIR